MIYSRDKSVEGKVSMGSDGHENTAEKRGCRLRKLKLVRNLHLDPSLHRHALCTASSS